MANAPEADMTTPTTELLTKDEVRSLFMANGFTIKEGQTDLKPYVYAAYDAIERALLARLGEQQPVAWGIFDSSGFLEDATDEGRAKKCADYYNTQGPLKPYSAMPLYTHPSPAPVGAQERDAMPPYTPEQRAAACVAACEGLPDHALYGGWTAAGLSKYAKSLEDKLAARSAAQGAVQVPAWQPIETAKWAALALLYAPPEKLYEKPDGKRGEMRVTSPASWVWATHWMPLPAAPAHAGERSDERSA